MPGYEPVTNFIGWYSGKPGEHDPPNLRPQARHPHNEGELVSHRITRMSRTLALTLTGITTALLVLAGVGSLGSAVPAEPLATATSPVQTPTAGTAAAPDLGSPAIDTVAFMWTTTAYCGTTRGPNGSIRVSVGDWGSMAFLPSKYSLMPSQLRVGQYYKFQIDPNTYRVYDVQRAYRYAFDLNPCRRIGVRI